MIVGYLDFAVELANPHSFLRCLLGITGKSRRQLAKEAHISIDTLHKIADGTNKGSVRTWGEIARVVGTNALEIAAGVTGAATELLEEVNESIAVCNAGEIRLFYLIAPSGKLVIYDSDFFEEQADNGFIAVPLDKAKAMLEWQQKELGS